MRIEQDIKLDFKDVLIRPKRSTLSSRSEVVLERTYTMPNAHHKDNSPVTWTGIPICASNMDTTGTFSMTRALAKHKCLTAIHKHYSVDEWVSIEDSLDIDEKKDFFNYVALSLGTSGKDLEKTIKIVHAVPQIKLLMIDIANGYSEGFVDFIKTVRANFPDRIIFAGNVVTAEMTEELILAGADCIKVGIGSGSACQTRTQTGVGYPQLSAIIECADAAHGIGRASQKGLIMADGGITCPGDVAKAFGAGSDFIMIGGLFAGHKESECSVVNRINRVTGQTEQFIEFYGMSSRKAMDKYNGGMAEYRASEGKELLLPYRGSVDSTILDILGGLRSACTYVGARTLKELSKRTTFVRVTQQINAIYG